MWRRLGWRDEALALGASFSHRGWFGSLRRQDMKELSQETRIFLVIYWYFLVICFGVWHGEIISCLLQGTASAGSRGSLPALWWGHLNLNWE